MAASCAEAEPEVQPVEVDACAAVLAADDASQDATIEWDRTDLAAAAEASEDPALRQAFEGFADSVEYVRDLLDGRQPDPGDLVDPWVANSDGDVLGWWAGEKCSTFDMAWELYDPRLNPSGLTVASNIPRHAVAPRPESPYEVAPFGEPEPVDGALTLFADVDRRCFALGEIVDLEEGGDLNPGSTQDALDVVADVAVRKSCMDDSDDTSSWSGQYGNWSVRVEERDPDATLVSTECESSWWITRTKLVLASDLTCA